MQVQYGRLGGDLVISNGVEAWVLRDCRWERTDALTAFVKSTQLTPQEARRTFGDPLPDLPPEAFAGRKIGPGGLSRWGDGGIREVVAAHMILKAPLPGSAALLEKVQERLGPDRLPLLIAIDGPDDVGKSSLASWLAWQIGAPAVYLDLYVIRGSKPLRWLTDELQRILNTRLVEHRQPLVIEGIMILDVLAAIDHEPDFLVYLYAVPMPYLNAWDV